MKTAFNKLPLALKLSIMISLLIIAAISIFSVTTLNKQSEIQDKQIADFSQAMSAQLAASLTEPLFTEDFLSQQIIVNNFAQLPRTVDASIVDNQFQLLTQSENAKLIQQEALALIQRFQQQPMSPLFVNNGIAQVVTAISFKNKTAGHVITQFTTELLSNTYTTVLNIILWLSLGIILLGLLAAHFISKHVSNPIKQMLEATQRMSQGNFNPIEERRDDELGKLINTINQMGNGLLRKQQVETLLDRFLDKDVAKQLLTQLDTVEVRGERVEASVLFADIVGFTSMSEQLSPEKVAELLNEYFSYFTACANRYFGTIDKFIGDCAMVVFGAPKADKHHQFHAIACAVLMQKLTAKLNQKRQQQGLPQIQLRIGINSGPMLAGILGDHKRMEYTVVGDSVNLASRLCNEAQAGEILITAAVCELPLSCHSVIVDQHKTIRVRGKAKQVTTYLVNNVATEHQLSMDSLIEDILSNHVETSKHPN